MAVLKIKNDQGVWEEVLTLNGRDGAIQYVAGPNIRIDGNVISATNSEGTVTREDVEAMIAAIPLPTKVSDLTNDEGFLTEETEPAFNASDAKGITAAQILAWTAKQDSIVFNTTYNPTSNKAATMADIPVVPTVPTKLSDLTNDTGFITSSDIPSIPTKLSDLTNDEGFITNADIPTKVSDLTNDSGFITSSDLPTVPTKLSDLLNDRGYITQSSVPTQVSALLNDAGYITNTYHDNTKQDKLTAGSNININGSTISAIVPTKVSDLTNDSGFMDNDDVENYVDDRIFDINVPFTIGLSSKYAEDLDNGINASIVTPNQTIVDYIAQFVNKAVKYGNNVSSLNKTAAATFSLLKYEKPSIRVTMPMTAVTKGDDPNYSGWNRTIISFATVTSLPESSSNPNTTQYYNVTADIIITHLSTVSTIHTVSLRIKRRALAS